ncbi:MAG: C-GCAxxG-C-C family protein [bacterium]
MNDVKKTGQNPKKALWKCGACSHAVFNLLNQEFDNHKETEERASDPLAGGIMQKGEQCGMLWGGTLAIGTESYRRNKNQNKAIAAAITSTGLLVESFVKRTKSVNCRDITNCDFSNKVDFTKYIIKTILCGFIYSPCFNLIEKWTPEAIFCAKEGLSAESIGVSKPVLSCSTEVAKKMGASDEEMVMVAGFAGGLGLSGNACGALSAAIWKKTLEWCKVNSGTPPFFKNENAKKIVAAFNNTTNSEILCSKITGKSFKTVDEHTEFIKAGGCSKLIDVLSQS